MIGTGFPLITNIFLAFVFFLVIPFCAIYAIWDKSGKKPIKTVIICNLVLFQVVIPGFIVFHNVSPEAVLSVFVLFVSLQLTKILPIIWSVATYFLAKNLTIDGSTSTAVIDTQAVETPVNDEPIAEFPTKEHPQQPPLPKNGETAVCVPKEIIKLKKAYPWFDYDQCMNNAAFSTAVNSGMPIQKAYKLFFKDEIEENKSVKHTSKFWTYKHTIIILIAVIVCAVAAVPVIVHQSNEISALETQLSIERSRYNQLKSLYDDQMSDLNGLREMRVFVRRSIVIVPSDGSKKYHKYGCKKLDMSDGYWVFNPEYAIDKGYRPCSSCN